MIDGHRLVVVTPAGRHRFLELLLPYVLRERGAVDEYRLWVNTEVPDDLAHLRALAEAHPGFVTLDERAEPFPKVRSERICHFFDRCADPGTVYVRLDDDICWVEPGGIERLAAARLAEPAPFLLSANVVNNCICTHIHQRLGGVTIDAGICGYSCMDPAGWKQPHIAIRSHHALLTALEALDDPGDGAAVRGATAAFRFSRWELWFHERFSINAISWLGREFARFGGRVERDEEQWLTTRRVLEPGVGRNVLCGEALVAHYAFHTQLGGVDRQADIYQRYRRLAERAGTGA